jgi:hypothetical protein
MDFLPVGRAGDAEDVRPSKMRMLETTTKQANLSFGMIACRRH